MKPIIFLDIDGVLNNRQYLIIKKSQGSPKGRHFDPESISILKEIIEETGAEVVLSSTWRYMGLDKVQGILSDVDFDIVFKDETPFINDAPRGWEIYKWMSKNLEKYHKVRNYLIIDDDGDMMLWQADNFVNTNFDTGLRQEHKARCIEILSRDTYDEL
jgi:hypothetical protein